MSEPPTSDGAWLGFRFYIEGKLITSDWLDCLASNTDQQVERIKSYHVTLQAIAEEEGKVWMVEVYDPDEEPGREYIRMGTDSSMMVDPIMTSQSEMAEILKDLRSNLEA